MAILRSGDFVTEGYLFKFAAKALVVLLTVAAGWGAFIFQISTAKAESVGQQVEKQEAKIDKQTEYIFLLSRQMATGVQPEQLKHLPDAGEEEKESP